jgi:hypothetical protein
LQVYYYEKEGWYVIALLRMPKSLQERVPEWDAKENGSEIGWMPRMCGSMQVKP